MKCISKNLTENVSNFDGVLYESYTEEKNWWDVDGAKGFIAAQRTIRHNADSQLIRASITFEAIEQYSTLLCIDTAKRITDAFV